MRTRRRTRTSTSPTCSGRLARQRRSKMSEEIQRTTSSMSKEELEAEMGRELTDREAMSLVNANLAAPVNAAVAANGLWATSVPYATAEQDFANIDQSN